ARPGGRAAEGGSLRCDAAGRPVPALPDPGGPGVGAGGARRRGAGVARGAAGAGCPSGRTPDRPVAVVGQLDVARAAPARAGGRVAGRTARPARHAPRLARLGTAAPYALPDAEQAAQWLSGLLEQVAELH